MRTHPAGNQLLKNAEHFLELIGALEKCRFALNSESENKRMNELQRR
jgi:hypothetical protein